MDLNKGDRIFSFRERMRMVVGSPTGPQVALGTVLAMLMVGVVLWLVPLERFALWQVVLAVLGAAAATVVAVAGVAKTQRRRAAGGSERQTRPPA